MDCAWVQTLSHNSEKMAHEKSKAGIDLICKGNAINYGYRFGLWVAMFC